MKLWLVAAPRYVRLAAVASLAAPALAACGCARPTPRERLASLDPNQRSQAVVEMARSADPDFLPDLVECLEDDDPSVRFCAILALERMTGTRLGYSYGAPPSQRRAAYHAWRAYLATRSDPRPAARADGAQPAVSEAAAAKNAPDPPSQATPGG